MSHSSINEDLKGLNVPQKSEYAKLYRQATEDAAFLRSLCVKQDTDSDVRVPFRSSSLIRQEYALYRQRYLVTYCPFKTFGKKEPKKSTKEKKNKVIMKLKKENTKTTEPKSNKDKSLSSVGFLKSVPRFLRFFGWA